MALELRPMLLDDLDEVDRVWRAAFAPLRPEGTAPESERTEEQLLADRARFAHLVVTDPDGSFVVIDGEEIVGLSQSLLRCDEFVLSRLGVVPTHQDRGIGGLLLANALRHAEQSRSQRIWSSRDPRALHSYVKAGFTLHPTISLTGRSADAGTRQTLRRALRSGSSNDLEMLCAIDEQVRHCRRAEDLALWIQIGAALVVDDDGGYLLMHRGRITTLCATDEVIARGLLAAALVGFADLAPAEAGWVGPEQRWAIEVATEVHATIAIAGAAMTRGEIGLRSPYLANPLLG
jgi:GNAT superfamily N-acetyltransferase